MTDHPVKVPPELFTEWLSEALLQHDAKPGTIAAMIADKAAQWGADQRGAVNEAELQKARDEELEACCEWLKGDGWCGSVASLRAARRPNPSSLAKQGMEALRSTTFESQCHYDAMFAALKRLAELEPRP